MKSGRNHKEKGFLPLRFFRNLSDRF